MDDFGFSEARSPERSFFGVRATTRRFGIGCGAFDCDLAHHMASDTFLDVGMAQITLTYHTSPHWNYLVGVTSVSSIFDE